jgi:AraC-like DNA-binding protein
VTFPFAAPRHHKVYPLLFPGPVHFDAVRAGFSFDAQYLSMPLRRDERALQAMLQRALLLPVLQYRHDRLLMQRVRDLLRARAAQFSNADSIARALHISTRTLHRRLKEEGSSLQRLKDDTRRDHAIEFLCRGNRPIKQIARLAGFRNEKSFARAFRDWTGRTPSEYRRARQP